MAKNGICLTNDQEESWDMPLLFFIKIEEWMPTEECSAVRIAESIWKPSGNYRLLAPCPVLLATNVWMYISKDC